MFALRSVQTVSKSGDGEEMSVADDAYTGKNKLIINHLDRLFVTNDAATIVQELEVVHPAAKLIVMASRQQEQEVG